MPRPGPPVPAGEPCPCLRGRKISESAIRPAMNLYHKSVRRPMRGRPDPQFGPAPSYDFFPSNGQVRKAHRSL